MENQQQQYILTAQGLTLSVGPCHGPQGTIKVKNECPCPEGRYMLINTTKKTVWTGNMWVPQSGFGGPYPLLPQGTGTGPWYSAPIQAPLGDSYTFKVIPDPNCNAPGTAGVVSKC
jgi:hypothetical protein